MTPVVNISLSVSYMYVADPVNIKFSFSWTSLKVHATDGHSSILLKLFQYLVIFIETIGAMRRWTEQ